MMQLKDYHLLNIFPQRSYKKDLVYILRKCPICIATGIKTDKGQPQKLCISVTFTQVSKLFLHPDILPSLVYINVKLLKTTKKMEDENRFIKVCIIFVLCIFIFCSYKLVF